MCEEGGAFLKNPSRLRTGSKRQTAAASPHEALELATLIRAAAPTYEGGKKGLHLRVFFNETSVTDW